MPERGLPAAEALLWEARNASLLVVGTRGRGGFAGLLLGSVSRQCANYAPCARWRSFPTELGSSPLAGTAAEVSGEGARRRHRG